MNKIIFGVFLSLLASTSAYGMNGGNKIDPTGTLGSPGSIKSVRPPLEDYSKKIQKKFVCTSKKQNSRMEQYTLQSRNSLGHTQNQCNSFTQCGNNRGCIQNAQVSNSVLSNPVLSNPALSNSVISNSALLNIALSNTVISNIVISNIEIRNIAQAIYSISAQLMRYRMPADQLIDELNAINMKNGNSSIRIEINYASDGSQKYTWKDHPESFQNVNKYLNKWDTVLQIVSIVCSFDAAKYIYGDRFENFKQIIFRALLDDIIKKQDIDCNIKKENVALYIMAWRMYQEKSLPRDEIDLEKWLNSNELETKRNNFKKETKEVFMTYISKSKFGTAFFRDFYDLEYNRISACKDICIYDGNLYKYGYDIAFHKRLIDFFVKVWNKSIYVLRENRSKSELYYRYICFLKTLQSDYISVVDIKVWLSNQVDILKIDLEKRKFFE